VHRGLVLKECFYSYYSYPNIKSRLKTYFLKIIGFYKGEVWKTIASFQVAEDNDWRYSILIMQALWCKQVEVLWMREWKH